MPLPGQNYPSMSPSIDHPVLSGVSRLGQARATQEESGLSLFRYFRLVSFGSVVISFSRFNTPKLVISCS